jgi:hypothetical protein
VKPHPDKAKLDALFPAIREYQALATAHGIGDIFQDNGGKLLQLVLTLGLRVLPGREGADAIDEQSVEYELKSVNLNLTRNFSTHHHLNPQIVEKYRKVDWIFAIYRGIELSAVYQMSARQLEPLFAKWLLDWDKKGGKDLNNPKIPVAFVADNGVLVHGVRPQVGLRPAAPRDEPPPVDPFEAD